MSVGIGVGDAGTVAVAVAVAGRGEATAGDGPSTDVVEVHAVRTNSAVRASGHRRRVMGGSSSLIRV